MSTKHHRTGLRPRLLLAAACLSLAGAAHAQDGGCDRTCLSAFADQVVRSMVAHQPQAVAMAAPYAATENSRAYQLKGMSLWRTVQGIEGQRHDVIDPESGQIFSLVVLREASGLAILKLRLKVAERKITELEAFVSRDQADTGEHFKPSGVAEIPALWWQPVAAGRRNSRAELMRAGQAAFDASITLPFQPGCFHFEEGDKVGQTECGAPSDRPSDPKERVPVVDVEQGIAVSIADVDGVLTPGGSFVPNSMMVAIRSGGGPGGPGGPGGTPMRQRPSPVVEQPETLNVIQLTKLVGGIVQGTQAYMNSQGPGARSPWVR